MLLLCQQHGFLSSEENVILNNFLHLKCVGIGVSCSFLQTHVWYMVNDICNGKYYSHWFMLADVMPISVYGRCYAKCSRWNTTMADVIATIYRLKVADVLTIILLAGVMSYNG